MKLQHALSYVWLLSAAVSPLCADDLIIESRPGGKNPERYGETTGAWRDSNTPVAFAKSEAEGLSPQAQIGSRACILPKTPGTDTEDLLAAARFTPELSATGRYFVYVTWPKGANAAPVRYLVRHSRGTDAITLAQNGFGYGGRDNANTWNFLGEFEFAAGKDHYVELRVFSDARAVDPNTPARAYADAVRFSAAPLAPSVSSISQATALSSKAATASSGPRVHWLDSVTEGLNVARSRGKSILIFFYSPTSERSMRYEEEVFGHEEVRTLLEANYVTVRVDMQKEANLASRMRAYKSGTINLYDKNGDALGQISDNLTGEALASRLRTLR